MSESRRVNTYLWEERCPLLVILGFFIISCFLVSPLRNVPIIDDWGYVISVEKLIQTGHLFIPDSSSTQAIAQILWGAIFALVFGPTFGVLRLTTVLLAIIACIALYLTLRELGMDRWRSLLGALMLAVSPVFFLLSFSFMTDVPFLSMMNLAVLCYIAGLKRDKPSYLWLGGLFASASFLIRPVGLAIPLALLPCLITRKGGWPKLRAQLIPFFASLVSLGFLWLWLWKVVGRTGVINSRWEGIRYWFLVSPGAYFDWNLDLLFRLSFWVFPLLIAALSFKPKWWPLAIAVLAVVGALLWHWRFGEFAAPWPAEGEVWSMNELGLTRNLIQGKFTAPGPMQRFSWPAILLMIVSTAIFVVGTAYAGFKARGRISKPTILLITLGLLQVAIINALWFYHDRYYLVLLPIFICLSLKLTLQTRFSKVVALSGIILLSFVSISGTWDALRFNQACLDAFNELRSKGVPIADIDVGYSLTAWTLYVHPENLPPGETPAEDAPWVTSGKELPYVISNTPLPGHEIIKEISWRGSLWAVSNRIYVLHKQEK